MTDSAHFPETTTSTLSRSIPSTICVPSAENEDTRILVIGDTPAALEPIVTFLESEGFTILLAKNSESSIQQARYTMPHLILMDVLMSDMDGLETCRRLKQDAVLNSIPVIFMAALTGGDRRARGLEVGAVDYITKPIHHQELLARIRLHLKLQTLTETLAEKDKQLIEANQKLEQQVSMRTRQLTQSLKLSKEREQQSNEVSDGIVILDADTGRLLMANTVYCSMHDYDLEGLLNCNPFEFIPLSSHQKFETLLRTVKSNQVFTCDIHDHYPDGTPRCLEIKAVPFFFKGHHSALALIRDITDRQQMEIAIRNNAEQFQSMFENVGDGLVVIDLDTGMLLTANPAYCDMHGYSYEEILNLSPLDLIPPTHHEKYEAFLSTVKAGQTFTCEANCRKPDGTPFWIEIKSVPFMFDNRLTALSVIRDVTERKQMESAMREAELQFRSIFENVSDGLVIIDLESGMLLTANPAYCAMHGYRYDEILQLDPLELIPPHRHSKYKAFLSSVKMGQKFTCEANCKKPDGKLFCIEIKSVPFQFCGRQTALSVIRDVTERKQMERAIQDKNVRLEKAMIELQRTQLHLVQSEKMSSLGQLVAGVAHEINNPVSFIHGNLSYVQSYARDLLEVIQLYQKHYPDPAAEITSAVESVDLEFVQGDLGKILKSMEVGTERISEIVQSLRNFSRMDEAERKVVDIHQGIDSALRLLRPRLADYADHPDIQVVRDYGDLPSVRCYPGRLNQVFMTVLVNAIDAFDEMNESKTYKEIEANPNWIQIRTSVIDLPNGGEGEIIDAGVGQMMVIEEPLEAPADGSKWVEVAIADNGPGIPEDIQQKIFEPFFTTKPVGKGTGMGLSISYQTVVESHGGRLSFSSTEGSGTEFVIQIPVNSEQ